MEAATATQKIFLLTLVTTLAVTTAAAQGATLEASIGTVWTNDAEVTTDSPMEYECSGSEFQNITATDSEEKIMAGGGTVSSAEIIGAVDESTLGEKSFTVYCKNNSKINSSSALIDLKELDVTVEEEAQGFFGSKVGDNGFERPFEVIVEVKDGSPSSKDIEEGIEFGFSSEPHLSIQDSVDWVRGAAKIEPYVEESFPVSQDSASLDVTYSGGQSDVSVSKDVGINVYPYKLTGLSGSNDRRTISYDNVGDLEYLFDLEKGNGISEDLHDEDFRLDVIRVSGDDSEEVYEDKKWFRESQPEGDREYRITLNTIPPDLTLGEKYRFKTHIMKDGDKTPIHNIRVVNDLKFSGVVRDSAGGPVETEMALKRVNSENIPVNTGSDGTYSTTIEERDFDTVNLKFFDRGRNAPDTEFQLTDLTLGENPNLGFSSEAIRYQYWENPVADVEGLEEVNMMAGKFSHQIDGGAEAFMKFDPQSVNPEDLKVYECNSWNFQGRECMSSWDGMDSNDVSVDYSTWRVNLEDLDLHEISEDVTGASNKTVLMNAYIVGKSSELGLEGEPPLSISSQTLAANADLSISGKVVNGEGEAVPNADVEVSLRKDGESFRTLNPSSGPNGGFEANGKAPSESGRYKVRVDISKKQYQDFRTESSKTVEVYYERGLSLSSTENTDLQLGEESTLSFSLSNTGQQTVEDISLSLTGLEDQYYTKASVPQELDGEGTVEVDVDLPSDYCPAPCASPPVIDLEASGTSGGENVEASTTLYTSINREASQTGTDEQPQGEEEDSISSEPPEGPENQTSSLAQGINNMTGNFLKRQSSVNIALGLILVFTLILAAAIRKKKTSGQDDRRMNRGRGRPVNGGDSRVSKPQVAPDTETEPEEGEIDEEEESREDIEEQDAEPETEDQSEDKEDGKEGEDEGGDSGEKGLEGFYDEEKDTYVCDETGEEFDTKEGLKMHRKINNIDS